MFAFIAVAAIALTSGTAHADEASTSAAGESRSEKSSDSADHRSRKDTADAAESADSVAAERPRVPGSRSADPSARVGKKPVRHLSVVRDAADSTQGDTADDAPADAAADEGLPTADASTRTGHDEPRSRHLDRHLRPVSASVTASLTTVQKHSPKTDPRPSAVEPTVGTKLATPTTATTVATAATTTNVVALPGASSSGPVPSRVGTTLEQQVARFVRQLTGLASDTGIVGASLVNNLAAYAATAIGPQPLWGVPYHIATGIAQTAGTVSKVLSGTSLTATSTGPFKVDYGVLDVLSFLTPTKVPAGANDPSITLTAAHPLPVILVNGTVETQALNWSVGAPVLANAGYKVYTFNYGNVTPFPGYPFRAPRTSKCLPPNSPMRSTGCWPRRGHPRSS